MRKSVWFVSAFLVIQMAGCGSEDPTSVSRSGGMLQLYLTDQPIELKEVWVTFREIEVHRTGGGWITFLEDSDTLDLLTIQDTTTLLGMASLEDGEYTGFRLQIVEGFIVDQEENRCELKVPSSTIKIPVNFQIESTEVTSVVLDFDAKKSVHVVQTGNRRECILRPVIQPVIVETQG